MHNNLPLVSFVMVNLKGESFLLKNLTSVFSQRTKRPFEVILVDNGSTDRSLKIVEEGFPRVRVMRNTANLGLA